jgi:hypothetical protein
MTTLNVNGKSRKTLASQIDRLDTMLDGLSEALDESVAAAVKVAVAAALGGAVRAAVTEALNHPDFAARLQALTRPTTPTEATNSPSWTRWLAHQLSASFRMARRCADDVIEVARHRALPMMAQARALWTARR